MDPVIEAERPLLRVEGLSLALAGGARGVGHGPRLVRGVDLELAPGEALGLVGESGCGKSLLALGLLDLLPPGIRWVSGEVWWEDRALSALAPDALAALRGPALAIAFQDARAALNPVLSIGQQLSEGPRRHLGLSRAEARARAVDLLRRVGVSPAEERLEAYAHQLSGGTCQRVGLALALCCSPRLLIADEPTTAVDPTLRLALLRILAAERRRGMALLLISHDLAVVAQQCARLAVLYAGEVVEQGSTDALLRAPRHPYTALLLAAARHPRRPMARAEPPRPGQLPPGCAFAPRCPRADQACRQIHPALEPAEASAVRCLHPLEPGGPR